MPNYDNCLLFLQNLQEEHDLIAHEEVVLLNKEKRINHYVLHFYKYASNLMNIENDFPLFDKNNILLVENVKKQIRDTFLLNLAIANSYNVELKSSTNETDFRSLLKGNYYNNKINDENIINKSYKSILSNGSRLAKTIEAIDHLEPINIEKDILFYNQKILIDILEVMSFLQENCGIYWEKEIIFTHALIKSKKPWIKTKYMRSMNDSNLVNFDLNVDLDNLVKQINDFVDSKNTTYKFNIKEYPLNISIKGIDSSNINEYLAELQILQNKKEGSLQITNPLRDYSIKKHLDKTLFILSNNLREIVLMNEEVEKKDGLKVFLNAFEIMLSLSSKLNQNIQKFLSIEDIDKKSLSEILKVIQKENGVFNNLKRQNTIILIGNLSEIIININTLNDKNERKTTITDDLIVNLSNTFKFILLYGDYLSNKYNLNLEVEIKKHLEFKSLFLKNKII